MRLFDRRNGQDLRVAPDDAFELAASISNGTLWDVPAIAGELRRWVVDLDA